jgi:very-short-patch-repair endonuclease
MHAVQWPSAGTKGGWHGLLPLWEKVPEGRMRGSPVSTMLRQRPANNRVLQDRARALRRSTTLHERWLWEQLRGRRFIDFKFRRQSPIGRYVADFVCFGARLIIELDGSQHAESARDVVRDAEVERRGFRVLRFWNNQVIEEEDSALEAILIALQERTGRSTGND